MFSSRFLSMLSIAALAIPSLTWAGDLSAVEQRMSPVGQVEVDPASLAAAANKNAAGAKAARSGQAIYQSFCVACHQMGIAGAPKFGDKAAWAPHMAKGINTLYQNAIKGINAMPPKGTCMDCSDDEIKATVDYMVEHLK